MALWCLGRVKWSACYDAVLRPSAPRLAERSVRDSTTGIDDFAYYVTLNATSLKWKPLQR
jgi:hypothetical protein